MMKAAIEPMIPISMTVPLRSWYLALILKYLLVFMHQCSYSHAAACGLMRVAMHLFLAEPQLWNTQLSTAACS
jgi:hypothetical protein